MYDIKNYNKKWPLIFKTESKSIGEVLGDGIVNIFHVGSTAVPSMKGKSTIDILVTVDSREKIHNFTDKMIKIGYQCLGAKNGKKSLLFEKWNNGERAFIVHFYEKSNPEVKQILSIRDYLRSNHEEVENYSNFKQQTKTQFPDDYSQYRNAKDEYMKELIKRANREMKK